MESNENMVSFVYFDVGGVVVLDFSGTDKWKQLEKELGISAYREAEFEAFFDKYEPQVNAGRDVDSLLPMIKKKFGSKLPDSYSFLINGFVNRFEVNKSIWPVINKIHQKCRIGLLTNMYPHMLEAIRERGLSPKVKWDSIVDSSKVGILKPDPKIFQLAERQTKVEGKEILFVENSKKHIDAAKKLNWQTFLYDPVHAEESSSKLSALF